jgi:hypothetical protein
MSDKLLKDRENLKETIIRKTLVPLGVPKTVGKKSHEETSSARQLRIKAEFARLNKLHDDEMWDKHTETLERHMAGSPVKVSKAFKRTKYDTIHKKFQKSLENAQK